MTKKQFVNSKGDTWEWEETEETAKALKEYYALVNQNKNS